MAKWHPPSEVGSKEQVARRLFDQPKLAAAPDRPQLRLELRHFEDSQAEVSLDRLGRTGIEPKIVKELEPWAAAAAERFKPKQKFYGWQAIKAEALTTPFKGVKVQLVASPTAADGDVAANPYHAHAVCEVGEPKGHWTALQLREIFERKGERIEAPSDGIPAAVQLPSFWSRSLRALLDLVGR